MIRALREYRLGQPFKQLRSIPVRMGQGKADAQLFIHANTLNEDPWEEFMHFPSDTLKLTLFSDDGVLLWQRDMGIGVIPGIWFEPVLSFDLDSDGVDEIYLLDNTCPSRPFTYEHRVLERMDPLTGEITGQWPWPHDLGGLSMNMFYRFVLAGGYAHGEPVLVCGQGAYGTMYLQGYNRGMEPRWKIRIGEEEPGPRASHATTMYDINHDGVDELFWGERLLSVDDGHEVYCGDRELFHAHSDYVIPFEDPASGKIYVFTCREGQDEDHISRVVTYDDHMNVVWRWPEGGHMHYGWVAAIGENRRYVAMAMSLALHAKGGDIHSTEPIVYYFDAVTGEPIKPDLPYPGHKMQPIDFNGDGYHEFVIIGGERKGDCIDRFGNLLAHIDGSFGIEGTVGGRAGKILDAYGHQIMASDHDTGTVWFYGDDEAVPGPRDKYNDFHRAMQHMMAVGYNSGATSTCSL